MKKHQYLTSCIILVSLILVGCNSQTVLATATPTETVTLANTKTPLPTSTLTPSPKKTDKPTSTITASPTQSCNADEVLKDIKANNQFDEFEVYYNTIQDITTLAVWYVDNDIDPNASGDEIEQNAQLALRSAAIISRKLAEQNSCIARLFTVINPIVVDGNYNGWFSGQVDPNSLPESELETIESLFEIGYFRTNPTVPYQAGSSGSCTWVETREKIQQHFSPERENVSFYFVIDDAGVNVWANWDGPTDFLAMPSILNVAMELDCLHPSPTQLIMMIVDNKGKVGLAGILTSDGIKNLDMNQLQIIYQ